MPNDLRCLNGSVRLAENPIAISFGVSVGRVWFVASVFLPVFFVVRGLSR